MVDNFSKISPLLKFEKPGDCYYVQLLRRQSDDPMVDGVPDPAYHGNMHSRSLKDYLITSVEQLQDLKNEIVNLCQGFSVRAYIRLNKRNYRNISLKMLSRLATQAESGTFSSPYHLIASSIGSTNQAGNDKTWIIDVDEEYFPHLEKIYQFARESNSLVEMSFIEIPTKHGIHIVCTPFNRVMFEEQWKMYCIDNKLTAPIPQTKSDTENRQYHFSLTGDYLEHVDAFADACRCCVELENNNPELVTVNPVDVHKTIIHSPMFNMEELKPLWNDYCWFKSFMMNPPDIHPDNPTILYVP